MDLLDPAFLLGIVEFLAVVAIAVAGVARLRGRRARLDGAAANIAAAASRSAYPPSLGGGGPEIPLPPDVSAARRARMTSGAIAQERLRPDEPSPSIRA